MINLDQYKGLIFDMDGTIVNSMPGHVESWRQTAQIYDFPINEQDIYDMGGVPSDKIVSILNQKYNLNLDPIKVSGKKREIFADIQDSIEIIPHTVEILKKHANEKKIGIGTGAVKQNVYHILENLQLMPYLDTIVTASDVKNHKPAPDTFLLVAKQLGLKPNECIVFEDTQIGINAAHAAGMNAIFVASDGSLEFTPNLF